MVQVRRAGTAVVLLAVLCVLTRNSFAARKSASQWRGMNDKDWEEMEKGANR
jgi:hypothetical protein